MDNPVTQFLTPTHTLVSTYVNKVTRHLFYDAFSGKLCYFTHTPTGVTFLADTGSVPNLIKLKTLKKFWLRAFANKTTISLPIQGVGGKKTLSSFVYISFCDVVVPFCVSEDVPFNIIGIDWIPVIANLPNFVVSYQRPSEVSTALTVLHGMDLITPPSFSNCMNVMCECCEKGKVITRNTPLPEDVHITEDPVGAGQPTDGAKDVLVCNVRTQFPEYILSEEDGIVVVSPSCVQDAQNSRGDKEVTRCEQGGRTVCDEQKYAVEDVPICNVRTQFPEDIPSEEDGIVVVSPSCVQDAQNSRGDKEVTRCEQGGRIKCDECGERYFFVTDEKLPASQADTLLQDLISRKKNVEILSSQKPSKIDLHSPTNTIIPRERWYAVYEPFHSQLTDLKGHLRGPQTLPYLCTVNLVDPKTPPFTCPAYPMRHPEQKKALEDNIAKYLDMGIIEYGPSSWKTSLFVVPQKVNKEQRQLPTYHPSQQWRVVQDFIPLNTKVQKIENTLPLIADVFQIASEKEIFSLLDLSKAFFHCKVAEDDRQFFGISHPTKEIRMRCMPMGFINSPSIWQKNMNAAIWEPVQQLFHKQYPDEKSSSHLAIYMDDIFIATKTVEQHLCLLRILFEHLTKYSLTLSIGKSFIGKRSVFLLGEVISPHQRLIQPERLRALTLLAPPQTVFQVRSFLGALRYVAEHIPRLNELLHPFDAHTGGVSASQAPRVYIKWTPALLQTFDAVKQILQNPSVLSHFVPMRPLYLETDASNTGYGAVLFQIDKEPLETAQVFPLAYSSQAWKTTSERAAHPCRKELDALKRVILKYHYLLRIFPFMIITDNMGVFHLVQNFAQGKPPTDLILVRYLQSICLHPILGIMHKPSRQVFTSDALSRMAWQQLAISSDDPIAWPTLFIAPSLMEAISRQITRHLRHSKCKYSKQGKHPVDKCLRPLCAGLSNPQFQLLLRELQNEPRLNFSGQWIMAKYGHSHGGDPLPPDLYDGPPLTLYHVTTLEALPSIKLRGLSPMTRWYIHFTSIAPPQLYDTHIYQRALRKGIPKVLSISTRLLLEHNINIFQTLSMNIYLVSTTIPYHLFTPID